MADICASNNGGTTRRPATVFMTPRGHSDGVWLLPTSQAGRMHSAPTTALPCSPLPAICEVQALVHTQGGSGWTRRGFRTRTGLQEWGLVLACKDGDIPGREGDLGLVLACKNGDIRVSTGLD